MRYSLMAIPLNDFQIAQGSYVEFQGNVMNPRLHINASERVRSTVTENSVPRNVAFDVGLAISRTLDDMGLEFTLEAPEDMSVQNSKRVGDIVQGDKTGDVPLSDLVKTYIKDKYQKPGNVYLGVVHRLDRPVSGVVLFAKTSKALPRLNKMFAEHQAVRKTYLAIVANKPPQPEGTLTHWLTRNEKQNTARAYDREVPGSKKAALDYRIVAQSERYFLLEIELHTGRHHQSAAIVLPARSQCIPRDEKVEAQVEALLAKMSLREKVGQMCELAIDKVAQNPMAGNASQTLAGGLLSADAVNNVFGQYKVGSILNVPFGTAQTPEKWSDIIRALNLASLEQCGVPEIYGVDQIHGASYTWGATLFPQEVGQGSSFNPAIP